MHNVIHDFYLCIFINHVFTVCCFREMTAGIKVRIDVLLLFWTLTSVWVWSLMHKKSFQNPHAFSELQATSSTSNRTDIVKAFNQIAAVTKILSYSFTILISWVEVISLSEWKQDFGKLVEFGNIKGIKQISLRRTYKRADLYFTSVVAVSFSSLSL